MSHEHRREPYVRSPARSGHLGMVPGMSAYGGNVDAVAWFGMNIW